MNTVTVKLAVPVFPAASDAVHVTVVPLGATFVTENVEPEAGEQVGPEVTPTSSDAVTSNVTVCVEQPLPVIPSWQEIRMSDGTVITGAVVSGAAATVKLINDPV